MLKYLKRGMEKFIFGTFIFLNSRLLQKMVTLGETPFTKYWCQSIMHKIGVSKLCKICINYATQFLEGRAYGKVKNLKRIAL